MPFINLLIFLNQKTIKDTEVLKRNYLANQNVYEKANDQKKEQVSFYL